MRRFLRCAPFVALACMPCGSALFSPAWAGDCRQSAMVELRSAAPDGYAVYRKIKDQSFFTRWISCDDVPLGLSTAVHESVHFITADDDAFPLVNGGAIKRPHEVSDFFAPSLIAKKFKASDFVTTYLRPGRSSSSSDFLYLLDELNAYSHDLNAAVDLKSFRPADQEVDNRDGLAALMAFVALYAETAEDSQPATWSGLRQPEVARTVAELWGHAETVMASSCGIPNFGNEDKTFIRQYCDAKAQSSMEKIIGRAPVCPTACLTATANEEQANEMDVDATPTGSARNGRPAGQPLVLQPFWSRNIIHHASKVGTAATGPEAAAP